MTTLIKMLNTLILELQKFGFNKNKSNAIVTTFSQQIQRGKMLLILIWA